jgi:flagellar hook-associated protein 3 FlgL
MRITNALVTRSIIDRLASSSLKLNEAQDRVSTGLKVQKMSDDPTAGSAIMQSSSALRAIEQFKRNVQSVGSQLSGEDTALGEVTNLLSRAKELAAGQVGVTASAQTRLAAAAEVKQLISQVVQVGNTKLGEGYLFGGANSPSTPPFDETQSATAPFYVSIPAGQTVPASPTGMRAVEAAQGQTIMGPHDGNTVFVQTGTLQALNDLYVGLTTNNPVAIGNAMGAVDTAFTKTQALVGDVGARANQVDSVSAGLDAYKSNLTLLKSDLSEVDMEEAITEMLARQTAYQAAMMATSKVMGMSLTDYLR